MSHQLHDPGGKVRLKVKSEIRSDAIFSPVAVIAGF